MGRLAKSWDEINYDYTSIDPSFMNLLREAAAKLGMEVGEFVVETLRERATTVLNEAFAVAAPTDPLVEVEIAAAEERATAESMDRMLLEHAAILSSLRRGTRQPRRTQQGS